MVTLIVGICTSIAPLCIWHWIKMVYNNQVTIIQQNNQIIQSLNNISNNLYTYTTQKSND